MVRVKRGVLKLKKRERILKYTKGFRWRRKSTLRAAREALLHAWTHQFRDRKRRKGDFRRLWQVRINAAVRDQNLRYAEFIAGLKKERIELDRKVLADLALHEPDVFVKIVEASQTK